MPSYERQSTSRGCESYSANQIAHIANLIGKTSVGLLLLTTAITELTQAVKIKQYVALTE